MMFNARDKLNQNLLTQAKLKLKRRTTEFQQGEDEGKALHQQEKSSQVKAYGAYKFKV